MALLLSLGQINRDLIAIFQIPIRQGLFQCRRFAVDLDFNLARCDGAVEQILVNIVT